MPVTAADVHNVAFNSPPTGRRGYDTADVDAFLEGIGRELVRLVEENNDLRSRVEGGGGTPAGPATDSRLAAELGELKAQLDEAYRDMAAAEGAADALRAELEQVRARDDRVAGGDLQGERLALRVLTAAERTASDHLSEVRREVENLLSDARSIAEEMAGQARSAVDALERDVRDRHREAIPGLEAELAAVQTHIDDLKEFERTYYARLRAYLDGRLLELGSRGPGPDTESPARSIGSRMS